GLGHLFPDRLVRIDQQRVSHGPCPPVLGETNESGRNRQLGPAKSLPSLKRDPREGTGTARFVASFFEPGGFHPPGPPWVGRTPRLRVRPEATLPRIRDRTGR